MKSKPKKEGKVLLLGEGGRNRMVRIIKRMKEESEALERLIKMKE